MRFTTAIAREMSARGNAARWSRHRLARAATASALATPQPIPAPDYALLRLTRVRAQLDRIDGMIATEKDPQKLDRLAAASMRLSDQEFALAGRPKPGNRKPAPAEDKRRPYYWEEIEPLPQPVPEPVPEPEPDEPSAPLVRRLAEPPEEW